ncbi:cytochrome b [Conservatibacter flavescens]|uniref:Cytochrome B n=1 Tax=Conservatibacter flavescens TaxID=28161 RepID=A0A2M8S2N7_9PAST|nr:cytochrome b [Conservatibacter flavescens]PJG85377.1 cytochrome B [Conservatibacter flavescens]
MHSDNRQYYGTISRVLHWLMAIAFAYILFTAIAGTLNDDYSKLLRNSHKSVGTILWVLIIIRAIWALLNRHRRPPAANILVSLGHFVLYLLMLIIPTVALIRQYGGARGSLEVFGVEVMKGAETRIDWMVALGSQWHSLLGWILFILVAGHIVMAIVHQIKGDKVLNRMAGKR